LSTNASTCFPKISLPILLIICVDIPSVLNLKATFKGAPPIFVWVGKISNNTSPKQIIEMLLLTFTTN